MSIKYRVKTGNETPGYRTGGYSAASASYTIPIVTTWPTSCANGDFVILLIATNNSSAATFTTPSGWSALSYDFGTTFTGMSYAIYGTTYYDDKSPPTVSLSPGAQPAGYWMMATFKGVKFSNIDVAHGDYDTDYPEQTGSDGQIVLFAINDGPWTQAPLNKAGFTQIYGAQQDSAYDIGIKMQCASSASNIGDVGGTAGAGYHWFAISAYLAPGGGKILDLEDIFITRGVLRTPNVRLMGWGDGSQGSIGVGSNGIRTAPTLVNNENWTLVAAGDSASGAITSDGALWVTGSNTYGMLGVPSVSIGVSSFVRVGSLYDWSKIAYGGPGSAVAIKTDGSMWSWGHNGYGQLGLGDIVNRSSPVRIGALSTWANVAPAVGTTWNTGYVLAIKTDSSLWSWGENSRGQLGRGDIVHRSSPVQVGSLLTWSAVGANGGSVVARTTTGQLWSWGYNANGQLGHGNIIFRSSPVQVGSLTTWAAFGVGTSHVAAIQTDGSLWTWGYNVYGQLGHGNTTSRSSPVRVGSLNDWADVRAGDNWTIALKTDGTLWAWGNNSYGVLGFGDAASRSSPTQITSLSNSVKSLPYAGNALVQTIFALTY